MGRWWRYKWITFHPSLTISSKSWSVRLSSNICKPLALQ
ncbi:integrase [Salmonella enterica]|nr:integrase [Salmonella enterica]